MNIYNTEQIRNWDAYTIKNEPIASINLMERAATAIVNELDKKNYENKPFYIFCGPGNNGGDGLAIARLLTQQDIIVHVFILESKKYSADFTANLQRLQHLDVAIKEIDGAEEFPIIPQNAIIIDALFGSGLTRPLQGLSKILVQHINQHKGQIIAIDIPSGLFADKTSKGNNIVKATTTFSFQSPKLAFMMAENEEYLGEFGLLDIGLHQDYTAAVNADHELLELGFVRSLILPRNRFSHKYQHGHAWLFVGSPGMYGAGILSASACMKSGVGLVSIMVQKEYLNIYQTAVPEAICIIDWDLEKSAGKKTALGIGPGWDVADGYPDITKAALSTLQIPMVVDAAALQMLAQGLKLPAGSIITPHVGEFEKCFGKSENDFERLELALAKAKELDLYIVLKGAHTLVVTPQGKSYFNNTGNPGMAKAGSGDVLTGLLTGLLAQGYEPLHACLLGVYLHGLAGDRAEKTHTQFAMTAMDIVHHFGEAWKIVVGS